MPAREIRRNGDDVVTVWQLTLLIYSVSRDTVVNSEALEEGMQLRALVSRPRCANVVGQARWAAETTDG
jgi:hypothetical protein